MSPTACYKQPNVEVIFWSSSYFLEAKKKEKPIETAKLQKKAVYANQTVTHKKEKPIEIAKLLKKNIHGKESEADKKEKPIEIAKLSKKAVQASKPETHKKERPIEIAKLPKKDIHVKESEPDKKEKSIQIAKPPKKDVHIKESELHKKGKPVETAVGGTHKPKALHEKKEERPSKAEEQDKSDSKESSKVCHKPEKEKLMKTTETQKKKDISKEKVKPPIAVKGKEAAKSNDAKLPIAEKKKEIDIKKGESPAKTASSMIKQTKNIYHPAITGKEAQHKPPKQEVLGHEKRVHPAKPGIYSNILTSHNHLAKWEMELTNRAE
ncbi:microtubule-associated protein 1B [Protobothrops mucrosquamatus]|uniref:microtubule-associated protein 1B n=1 Tax=Protobothrops mucrosquamatus TaxID=103944 RepID=UPI0007759E0C|nr:microtubule-associated protein 1B [Protobothrops mucrosquamatus]